MAEGPRSVITNPVGRGGSQDRFQRLDGLGSDPRPTKSCRTLGFAGMFSRSKMKAVASHG